MLFPHKTEVLSIIPNYEPKPSHVTMDEWNDFILTNGKNMLINFDSVNISLLPF